MVADAFGDFIGVVFVTVKVVFLVGVSFLVAVRFVRAANVDDVGLFVVAAVELVTPPAVVDFVDVVVVDLRVVVFDGLLGLLTSTFRSVDVVVVLLGDALNAVDRADSNGLSAVDV